MSRFLDLWDFDTDPNPDRFHRPVRIDFDGIKASTDAAILIFVGEAQYWIPKSQIGELEKTKIEVKHFTTYTELAPRLILWALLVLLIEILLEAVVIRRLP